MNRQQDQRPFYAGRTFRTISAIFGFFLTALGCYVLFLADLSGASRFLGGAVLLLLGLNTIYAAYTSKQSWLSRIGPLP